MPPLALADKLIEVIWLSALSLELHDMNKLVTMNSVNVKLIKILLSFI